MSSKVTKQWIADHLDMVEGVLQLLDVATGGTGLIHDVDVVGRIATSAIRELLDGEPPATRAEVDARLKALQDQLAAHDTAADTSLAARFDHGGEG